MKYCGVVYDVGLKFGDHGFSVEPFDPPRVEYDMRVIANEIHANAVRIEGEEISRLETATRAAHSVGLAVFFNPWKMGEGVDETRDYLKEAAKTAERLYQDGVNLIFVAGCEYTIFSKGIFPGESWNERAMWLGSHLSGGHASDDVPRALREKSVELNEVLRSFAGVVRKEFSGLLTYSAGTWELVDWDIFDIVGIDYYRRGETEEKYISGLQRYRFGKPLAVMEVGCCAYEGAAGRGDGGFMLLKGTNPDGSGIFEGDIVPTRSEREQADYLSRQLDLLSGADVHAVFVYVFSFPCMPKGEGPSDLDMMCFSLVKHFPDQDGKSRAIPAWAPKESFFRVAEFFRSIRQL
ncbi:hypothetical protein P170DRAFT_453152 [Aspergillus steynii IBT 23096]|uniref:Abortive infection protein n=1 Tax=Aspergillus steynii IBT 23096 TaxID=1392250 RepID=A0A2I2GES9_9EURO|nr:uncharacterized protein P170DRAFT_453152 [Aspergillus steynii IBT 23096]PLB51396.1 hypothetical protein P170DRAFT_453152 [Aspergillus steynii IBT 23096]